MLIQMGATEAVATGEIAIKDFAKLKHSIDLYTTVTKTYEDLPEL